MDIAFHTETNFLTINGYPTKKRNSAVGFLFVSFQEKENSKRTFHKLIFKLQSYFIVVLMSFMQHRQFQTLIGQIRTNLPSICLHIERGTIWVANFVLNCPINVLAKSLK